MPDFEYVDGEHLRHVPSWRKDLYAIEGGLLPALKDENVEETLMVQLTMPELSSLTFGQLVIARLFPELEPLANRICTKLAELCSAQEYLSGWGSTTEDDE